MKLHAGCVITLMIVLPNLLACSPVDFGMDDKTAAMKQGIFDQGDGTNGGPIDDVNNNHVDDDYDLELDEPNGHDSNDDDSRDRDSGDDGDKTPPTTTTDDDTTPPDMTLPTVNLCSDKQSEAISSNAMLAKSLKLEVKKSSGEVVCTMSNTAQIRSNLKLRKIQLANCALPAGKYVIAITNDAGKNVVAGNASLIVKHGKVGDADTKILMDTNPDRDDTSDLPYMGTECDDLASPLFVDLRRDSSDIDILSSPENGVLFDILGANGKPAYTKSKISWFERGRIGLLALPNAQGEVKNIDQLFGDNTKGPDGKFSDNGFLALAKYDANGDKKIDAKDGVFSKLRLWIDNDRDGQARPDELHPLGAKDVVSIDLVYDANFREVDRYGNEIKYKSVVELKDGKMKSIFDVWFKLH